MTLISKIDSIDFFGFRSNLNSQLENSTSIEKASTVFNDIIYEQFSDSIVLSRLFCTVPYRELPDSNKDSIMTLLSGAGKEDDIREDMMTLSLLATRGIESNWNDRKLSEGHVGVPLLSSDFVEEIPMITRLLQSLGLGLDWIDSYDSSIIKDTLSGQMAGLFFVKDAAKETDNKGRKIIAAQDFVKKYKVKSVFGIGGGYLSSDIFIVALFFLNEKIQESHAERFRALINSFKAQTGHLPISRKVFS